MCSQHAEFDRRTFLVNARGPLTAVNDLPRREADRVEILGTTELRERTREDAPFEGTR